jgi:transglutaminase-like putative cysteine protease
METTSKKKLKAYLQPTSFIDCQTPEVMQYAQDVINGATTDIEKAIKLYYRVRDDFFYDPIRAETTRTGLKASNTLKKKIGNCHSKSILLAAVSRAVGIPSRLGFADVQNHLPVDGLIRLLKSNVVRYHGYMEMFINDKWVKATPAFDQVICKYFNVHPLEFDGKNDSLFQELDRSGGQFMEYLKDHGSFSDHPFELIMGVFDRYYPHLTSETSYFFVTKNLIKELIAESRRKAGC